MPHGVLRARLFRHPALLACLWLAWGGTASLNAEPLAHARKLSQELEAANWTYGAYSQEAKRIDCTWFVLRVLERELGRKLTRDERNVVLIASLPAGLTDAEKQALFREQKDDRLRGVVKMIGDGGLGVPFDPSERALRPGDFVQYWYRDKGVIKGHCGIISQVEGTGPDQRFKLMGAHETSGLGETDWIQVKTRHRIYGSRLKPR